MNASDKRSQKKPKPLFGLFRKNKPEPVLVPTPLGSGISSVPLHSILSPQDPYAPPMVVRQPKPSVSDPRMPLSPQFHQQRQQKLQQQRRPRSKSTSAHQQRSAEARLLTERENALNKLCSNEITSPTLKEALPLLSPPPIPRMPAAHQQQPMSPITPSSPVAIRKFSSAHDLRKAAKLQQESIVHATDRIPIPKLNKDLSRSRSLNSPRHKQHQQQQNKRLPRKCQLPDDDDSDDDIPLGYLQSPVSKPSSLLSDQEEDDDKDLVPIAVFTQRKHAEEEEYQTAADKYKERVKERLQLEEEEEDDDDDIPISLAMLSPKERTKFITKF
ncbi:hypothetical protein K501DRAFT_235819 [Backusella circina FSU 941]|nr:hypothetical protein K501DRAFT_235819 [Backusella circina FSU 941]